MKSLKKKETVRRRKNSKGMAYYPKAAAKFRGA